MGQTLIKSGFVIANVVNIISVNLDFKLLIFRQLSWREYFSSTAYPDGKKALQEMLRVLKPGGSLLLLDVDYPADRNMWGYCLVKIGEWAGDIIKDIEGMLKQMRVTYLVKTIGGFGSVSLYVITKESEALPRQSLHLVWPQWGVRHQPA